MALPKIDTPVYTLTLPVAKKDIKFRPFLVKEQKILMMALESNDSNANEQAIKQVLQNCLITELDINDLAVVDVEYYLLNLRARSIGEIIESKYKCGNLVNDKECGNIMDASVNLLNIQVKNLGAGGDVIKLTDTISIKMKYPEFSVMEKIQNSETGPDSVFELVADCVDYILDGDTFHYAHEYKPNEVMEFLELLNTDQFAKVEDFFDKLPVIEEFLDITCSKCGFNHHIEIKGLDSFFG